MKKPIVIALAVGLSAGAADAARLRMNFAPNPYGTEQEVSLAPSDEVDVEIWLDLFIGGSVVVGVLTAFEQPWDTVSAAYAPGAIDQIRHNTDLGNWTELGVDAAIGPESGFARAAFGNLDNQSPIEAGSYLVGTATLTPTVTSGSYEITFYRGGNFPTITQSNGSPMVYSVGYYCYPGGYWAFGPHGNPGTYAGKIGRDPLIININPEPGTLMLLVLGGLSLLRRRR